MAYRMFSFSLSLLLATSGLSNVARAGQLQDCPGAQAKDCQIQFKDPVNPGPNILTFTPLTLAIFNGRFDEVKNLVEAGASLETSDPSKTSPLEAAMMKGDLDILRFLIEKGARVNAQDALGQTPLFTLLNRREGIKAMLELLVKAGADLDIQDTFGDSLLMVAASYGDADLVRYLLEFGARTVAASRIDANRGS